MLRNWLRYVFPTLLLSMAGILFSLRGLKAQGRLGDDFGKLTIRDQPPTNTIQKIMALKDALTALEDFLVNTNIALLKLRSVALSRHLHVSESSSCKIRCKLHLCGCANSVVCVVQYTNGKERFTTVSTVVDSCLYYSG